MKRTAHPFRSLCLMMFVLLFVARSHTRGDESLSALLGESQRNAFTRSVDVGIGFLRKAQNQDGSFGSAYQHQQTGLAILAFLSSGLTPDSDKDSPIPRACEWLVKNSRSDGFLGDNEFPTESHAVCALALSELTGMIPDPKQNSAVMEYANKALRFSLRSQDKGVDPDFFGGWRADFKTKVNDRTVTAWFLLQLKSASLRGETVSESSLKRAIRFLEQSQKVPNAGKQFDKLDTGGFSYDAEGLPVVAVTSAGLSIMNLYDEPVEKRDLALTWLGANPPIWYGPNFYFTHYFGSRGFAREVSRGRAKEAQRYFRRLWELLRDHQDPDGSFQLPPGNAEQTFQMGKPYATAMAILILNSPRNLLPVDSLD